MRRAIAQLLGLTALVGVVLLGLMAASIEAPLGFGGSSTDLRSAVVPHWQFLADALRAGRIPLWNPHIFTGHPELAGAQWGVLYPVQAALLLLLSVRDAILATIWLHLCLTFVAGYLLCAAWLRVHGRAADVAACTLGGLSLLGSGVVMGHLYAGHLMLTAATPWYVLGATLGLWALRGTQPDDPWALNTLLSALLSSAAFALGVLAGGIQVAPYAGLSALLIWSAATPVLRPRWQALATLAGTTLSAMALAAGQLLPTLELVERSGRRLLGQVDVHSRFLLEGGHALGLITPNATEDWERAAFIGGPVLALALARLLAPRRRSAALLWAGVTASWLLGSALASGLVAGVPGLQLLRVPSRSVWVVTTVLPLLAASAFALPQTERPSVMRLAAWICGGCALLVGMTGGGLAAAMLTALAAGALAWLSVRDSPRSRSLVVTATALVVLLGAASTFRPMHEDREIPGPLREGFTAVAPNYRVMTAPGGLWNLGMRYGYFNLGGYDPIMSARATLLARELSGRPESRRVFAIVPDRPAAPHPLWQRLGVRLVLGADAQPLKTWGKRLAAVGDIGLFEAPQPTPRVSFVACPTVVKTPQEALRTLAKARGPRVATVEADGVNRPAMKCPAPQATATTKIMGHAPESMTVEVEASGPGWLIVQDLLYPGWKATLDGKAAPMLHANGVGRALQVGSGRHVVVMTFAPTSVRLGLWLSGIGWLVWLMLVCGSLWRIRWAAQLRQRAPPVT